MKPLKELIAEQEVLQYQEYRTLVSDSRPYRCNTLEEYSSRLGFDWIRNPFQPEKKEYSLPSLIVDLLLKKDTLFWVDLCCGNGIALSQGRIHLAEKGIDPNRLDILGYDVLGERRAEVEAEQKKFSDLRDVLLPQYRPRIVVEDVHTATFPSAPDLVTAHVAMRWLDDPLIAFANAARQLKVEGYLAVHNIEDMYYQRKPDEKVDHYELFKYISWKYGGIPGFKIIRNGDCCLILQKMEEADFTFGLRLKQKRPIAQSFSHSYESKPL
ncbi:MAG: methyltransferase domain-containing protein [Candidatus Woesearchaeota archaeon]|jgi:SAM-dependent methyltransferase